LNTATESHRQLLDNKECFFIVWCNDATGVGKS